MLDVLDRYSRENGYTVVFDTSAQGSPVVYGSSQIDITQDLIRLYDQAYPVKVTGNSAPSGPATPGATSKAPAPSGSATPAAQPKAPAAGTQPSTAPKKPVQ